MARLGLVCIRERASALRSTDSDMVAAVLVSHLAVKAWLVWRAFCVHV
jgi:hypothetical protein